MKNSIRSFKKSKYKNFIENYPDIKFEIATIDYNENSKEVNSKQLEKLEINNVWEL
ncbi:MAG: hypothetical protein MK033_01260 [Candidatus Caenarcaniphilales bacterium]|nr:hypothetical protein [Candidatus Caenarcaniphilales bacterium]